MHEGISQHEIAFNPRGGGGFGFGDGGLGALLVGLLISRGGLFGNDRNGADIDATNLIQAKLGDIQGAIPLAGKSVENALAQAALGIQQGFANTKDAVQVGTVTTLNTANQTQSIIHSEAEKTRELINNINTQTLNRELAVAQSALAEERGAGRVRDVEVNVAQTVTQIQAQAQQQQQFNAILSSLNHLCGQVQLSKQAQDIVNLGTMTGSGTQLATNTQVS